MARQGVTHALSAPRFMGVTVGGYKMSKDEYFNVEARTAHIIRIGMQDIDFGFVPSGVEIPLIKEFQEQINKQGAYKLPDNYEDLPPDEKLKTRQRSSALYSVECEQETRMDNIRFVAIFTSFFFPEIDEEYISKHESGKVVTEAALALTETVLTDYYGVVTEMNEKQGSPKKAKASAKKKKP